MATMTIKIARAIAQDIGNNSAERRGLTAWDEEAWDKAAEKFHQLTEHFGLGPLAELYEGTIKQR
ncbi:hypothetical protein MTBLM1_20474 [Rhodospirillaceae bacterium LM-1]|nr:hypothetical protein MTBLM1_20474 [Rhodospirillaceae bacterium LM-1]